MTYDVASIVFGGAMFVLWPWIMFDRKAFSRLSVAVFFCFVAAAIVAGYLQKQAQV